MRRDFIYSLLLGIAIGVLALVLHFFTAGTPPWFQLAIFAATGTLLFGVHLALALRRNQQRDAEDDLDEPAGGNPRNPFLRELTTNWTGLDEYPENAEPTPAVQPESVAKRPAEDRDMV